MLFETREVSTMMSFLNLMILTELTELTELIELIESTELTKLTKLTELTHLRDLRVDRHSANSEGPNYNLKRSTFQASRWICWLSLTSTISCCWPMTLLGVIGLQPTKPTTVVS